MALVSPGVEVNVIDESFYTPAAAGTVPMIFVATAANKVKGSGAGVAEGTTAANQGRPYLITSQRELVETFGDPLFYSDNNGNMIHAGELNEYGLQTAYSLLGVTNRVYVCRADIDLTKLTASATAPGGDPADGTYWFDTQNTIVGLKEWNGAAITVTGGQSFTTQTPIVITDVSKVTGSLSAPGAPKASVGAIGDYAMVAITTLNKLWYKNSAGAWVEVGSDDWRSAWAAVRGTENNPSITSSNVLSIGGEAVTATGTTVTELAADINGNVNLASAGVTAAAVDGALEIYTTSDSGLVIDAAPTSDQTLLDAVGLTAGTYYAPKLTVAPHTSVPAYKTTDNPAYPSGSLWMQTTKPNGGADFAVKRWNSDTKLWETQPAPMYDKQEEALYQLDRTGGGANLAIGDIYINANVADTVPPEGTFKIYRRAATGSTKITSAKIASQLTGSVSFTIAETTVGSATFGSAKTVSFTANAGIGDADDLAGNINAAGLTNVVASVDAQNRVVIEHTAGGDMKLVDTSGHLNDAGFAPYDPDNASSTTLNLMYEFGTDNATSPAEFRATNWRVLSYTADDDAPTALAPQGELWYSSVVDEIDIMIHNGSAWVGYSNYDFGDGSGLTDPAGPIVSATEPTTQSDGTALATGDLWIDTADIENFPTIYRWGANDAWALVDKTDQTSENGVLFADARWSTAGSDSDAAEITDMLVSDYLDPDAPDSALYPKGMLLWNLRRSGFNVKRFEQNYIDTNNADYAAYYPHRWVTDSGNQPDGSGTFGRHAQRKSVIQSLQAEVNGNADIRDEESRQFNLIATPGYPELIGEMISLNYDRRLTAFVVGDSPFRLTPDATSLNEWATNVNLAVEDNDRGLVSRDEYLGVYYPAGFTSDNEGNNIVVPPSHMALRTLVLNDQVAYPWFAPAGTRRGGVTNASATGYVTSEGEFKSVALNTGQRDTLYSNAINPITFISGSGLVVFGQKTRARNASALDRINVARLTVYMRGQLELLARPYLFEPNDKITRDQVKAAADAFLLELVSLRAIYDFVAVCDETNNTPARIDRNELYLDIAIEPVKAIEFIYIPLRLKNTGEIAALG